MGNACQVCLHDAIRSRGSDIGLAEAVATEEETFTGYCIIVATHKTLDVMLSDLC